MKLFSDTYKQPDSLAALEWWVPTARNAANVKQPRAPYLNGGSYPAQWAHDLPAERRPERALKTVEEWADLSPSELSERGCALPRDAKDSTLSVGLILPKERLPAEIRPTLIDWDNVRNPETGEVHPVCARFLEGFGGYVAISQSGTGIHQWVFGEIPGNRKKYIEPIDSEPFVQTEHETDEPQVEIYDGGRHAVMTGKWVSRFGDDVIPGQDLLEAIVSRFEGGTEKSGPGSPASPEDDGAEDDEPTEHGNPAGGSSDGGDKGLPLVSPDERPLCYHRALVARRDGTARTNGHDTNLLASNLAINLGYSVEQATDDFAEYSGGSGTDFDRQITKQSLERTEQQAEAGNLNPPGEDRLQEAGILPDSGCESDCPIHGDRNPVEHVTVLPEIETPGSDGWGSLEAQYAENEQGLTQNEARARTSAAIESAVQTGRNTLIDALPTLGKSFGAVRAVAETGVQATIFTNRGRKEQYRQYREWAEDRGLSVKVLPSVWRTCGCFQGDYGDGTADLVQRWYRRGATGKEIHVLYESAVGEPIPCDGPAGDRCGFKSAWQADFDSYDLLLGSYVHSYVSSAVNGRTVMIDEYPRSAFETTLGGDRMARAVSSLLEDRPDIPFEDFVDVLENRDDDERRDSALEYLESVGTESDGEQAITKNHGHADSAAALWVLLAAVGEQGEQYSNGLERAQLPHSGGDVAVYNRSDSTVHILRKPNFKYARSVVALDGTPAPRLWETVQHKKLNQVRILSDDERAEYLKDCLNMTFVQTTDKVKTYNTPSHVRPAEDGALLEAIAEKHGRPAALITTQTAEAEHESKGLYLRDDGELSDGRGLIRALAHYGNLKGSNRFASERLGAVIGSNHFGDSEVEKLGAFVGADVSRAEGTKGVQLRYEENDVSAQIFEGIGQAIYRDMAYGETLQAALRFGRDGGGATVYLHTAIIPRILEDAGPPLLKQGRVIEVHSATTKRVLETLAGMNLESGFTTTRQVFEETDAGVNLQGVRRILKNLESDGFLEANRSGGRRGTMWFDPAGSLAETGSLGRAVLPNPKPRDSALTDEPDESRYRWKFRLESKTLEVPGSPTVEVVTRSA